VGSSDPSAQLIEQARNAIHLCRSELELPVEFTVCHCLCVHVCTCVLGSGGRLERTSPSSPECTLHRLGASPVLFQTIFSPVVEPYSSQKWQASLCSHAGASIPVLTHCFSACEQRKAQRGAIEAPSRHMWICVLHVRTLERALPHLRKRGGGGLAAR
jgi:hypothetical protein